jgi:hypothetical protein
MTATNLVRTRRYIKKFMVIKAHIQAISPILQSQNAMEQAMKDVAKAFQNTNRYVN